MFDVKDTRGLLEDAVVIDVGELAVIRATGADRVSFLHRVVTANVSVLGVGEGARSLLLTTKGQIVSDMRLFVAPDAVVIVGWPGEGEVTAAALNKYAVADDFQADVDPGARVLTLHGPRAAERLVQAGVEVPPDFVARPPGSHAQVKTPTGSVMIAHVRLAGTDGIWVVGPLEERQALLARLAAAGVGRLDPELAEATRIERGEPRFGTEINADYFPMEVGLGDAIDYAKGCYLGQEPIVRIRDRGHLNWRLARLRLSDGDVPVRGDALTSPLKERAGRITSAARSPSGGVVALAMLHVSVPAGAEVQVKRDDALLRAQVVET